MVQRAFLGSSRPFGSVAVTKESGFAFIEADLKLESWLKHFA